MLPLVQVCRYNLSLLSQHTTLYYGVVQGSVLGPVLFIRRIHPLFGPVSKCRFGHYAFAGDNQRYNISTLDAIRQSTETFQSCTTDVESLMTANKRNLNDNETEVRIIISDRIHIQSPLPFVIYIGDVDVSFALSVKKFDANLDSNLSRSQHVSNTRKAAYTQVRHISSIRHLLATQTTHSHKPCRHINPIHLTTQATHSHKPCRHINPIHLTTQATHSHKPCRHINPIHLTTQATHSHKPCRHINPIHLTT